MEKKDIIKALENISNKTINCKFKDKQDLDNLVHRRGQLEFGLEIYTYLEKHKKLKGE